MAIEDFSGAVSTGAFHLYALFCSTRWLLTSYLSPHGEEMAVVVPDITLSPQLPAMSLSKDQEREAPLHRPVFRGSIASLNGSAVLSLCVFGESGIPMYILGQVWSITPGALENPSFPCI